MKVTKLSKKYSPNFRYRINEKGKVYYAISKTDVKKKFWRPAHTIKGWA